jgi:hypothetical protein
MISWLTLRFSGGRYFSMTVLRTVLYEPAIIRTKWTPAVTPVPLSDVPADPDGDEDASASSYGRCEGPRGSPPHNLHASFSQPPR